MGMYRVFAGPDGESHIEELDAERKTALTSPMNVAEVKLQHIAEPRVMDFHPLPDRRLIIHLTGEVEIELSDGTKQIFRSGDMRLMEVLTGKGHAHRDLTPTTDAAYIILKD